MAKAPDPMEDVAIGDGVADTASVRGGRIEFEPEQKAAGPMEDVAVGSAEASCMGGRAGHVTAAGVTGVGTAILCATGLEVCA